MSVIFRQSLKSSIYSYAGVLIGFTTTALLMPKFLTPSEIGVIRQVQYYAMLASILMAFGLPPTIIRMFPHFNNRENHHNGFLKFLLFIGGASSVLFGLIFAFGAKWFLASDIQNSPLFGKYYSLILPFAIAALFFVILDQYATAVRESTIGVFLKDFVLRALILLLVVLFIYQAIGYAQLINGYTLVQFVPVVAILVFLYYKKHLLLKGQVIPTSSGKLREFITVAGFGWISSLGAIIVETTDSIMLSKLTDSAQVGVYTTVFYFASLLRIPSRALAKISSALISEHFKQGNLEAVHSIYKKSAMTQLIAGLFLFFNLILMIPVIFNYLLPTEYTSGKWVLVLIGLANMIRMGTGIKFKVVVNSEKYKWNTLLLSGFIILLIATNFWLIPEYGMTGAALATLISMALYHISGMLFLWKFYSFNPITQKLILLTFLSSILFTATYFVPAVLPEPFMTILRAFVFSVIFILLVVKYNFSPDLNVHLRKIIKF